MSESSVGEVARLKASAEFGDLDLELRSQKKTVLQGNQGISVKGPGVGNASLYMSQTRIAAEGNLKLGGELFEVKGLAWMDHEVLSSKLDEQTLGWDWFAIQLADGSEVMLYQLRRQDGSISPYSAGTIISATGAVRHLSFGDFKIDVLDFWSSPETGTRYPARWRLSIPLEGLELLVAPTVANQELITKQSTGVSYWEGRSLVTGKRGGQPVSGASYVELVGYKP